MSNSKTQCSKVRKALESGKSITQADALRWWGISRLASRVRDLRDAGMRIARTMKPVKNREGVRVHVAEYSAAK